MRKLSYFVAASVDGFIASPTGEIDAFPLPEEYVRHLCTEYPETLPTHVRPQLGIADAANKRYDTMIMGRGTYEPGLAAGITSPYAHLRQLVASTTLAGSDPAVEIVSGDPVARVRELKAEPGMDIWLAGGAKLAGALFGEIDEVIIKIYPVMLGAGIPVMSGTFDVMALHRAAVTTFDSGHVILTYLRA